MHFLHIGGITLGKRRGQGEGSISRRPNGSWQAQLELGRDPETGARVRKTVYGRTRREAAEKLLSVQTELASTGMVANAGRLTVGEYLQEWLDHAAEHETRPTTVAGYRRYVRIHAAPLAHVRLGDLQPLQIQRVYSERLATGLAPATVRQLHAILHRALKQAVRWGLIKANPADAVAAPRVRRREMSVFTSDQVRQLLAGLLDDMYGAVYYLAATTGMRRGELLALRWADLDLQRGVIAVARSTQELGGPVTFAEPKNERSRRLVVLTEGAVAVLIRHREEQTAARAAAVQFGLFTDQDLVFCRGDGQPLRPSQVSRHLGLLLKKLEMPHIRLHDLRHTHATLLLGEGVHPKIVSERLGHSTITLTLDTYSHVLPTMQRDAAKALDMLLSSPTASAGKQQGPQQ